MIQPEMLMTKQAIGMLCLWVRENEWDPNRLHQGRPKPSTNCRVSLLCQPPCVENVPCVCPLQLSTLKLGLISDISGSRGGWSRVEAQSRLPHAPHHPPLCLLRPQEDQDVSCIKGLFICQQKPQPRLSLSSTARWLCISNSLQESHTSVSYRSLFVPVSRAFLFSLLERCATSISTTAPQSFFIISWLIFNHCQLLWASVHVWWISWHAVLLKQWTHETRQECMVFELT